jgi:putative component of membrane protein insertase Oxa1/YidC/SpoIIIJ protein YidD
MTLNRIISIITICLTISNISIGQQLPSLNKLKSHFVALSKIEPRKFKLSPQTNEINLSLNLLFVGYKNYVSSQDQPNKCVFQHSCSEYCSDAIKQFGLIKGGLTAFDRLSRCHGFNRKNYEIDPLTNLLIDPLTNDY